MSERRIGRPRVIDGGRGGVTRRAVRLGPGDLEALRCLAHWGENAGPVSEAEAIRMAIHTAHGDMHDRSCRKCPKNPKRK